MPEGELDHLTSVTRRIHNTRRLRWVRGVEEVEERERAEGVQRVQEGVFVLEDRVDVVFGPGGVYHEKLGAPEGLGVHVHEDAVVSVGLSQVFLEWSDVDMKIRRTVAFRS